MQLSDFNYFLPEHLIATDPLPVRTASRLLVVDSCVETISSQKFTDILDLMTSKDCLIFNNTRVMSARLFGKKESGGQVELLVERCLSDYCFLAQIRASKAPQKNTRIIVSGIDNHILKISERKDSLYQIEIESKHTIYEIMEKEGVLPLPHYMKRAAKKSDEDRYQTVYAKELGAVAAPTAGLHFDEQLMAALEEKGVKIGFVTLHVGAGTFQPVRTENIEAHTMHFEYASVSEEICSLVNNTKKEGGRVVAVGTTSLRALESAAKIGKLKSLSDFSNLFIYPGYEFKIVDVLITNFHLPQSTLLMLVCAFGGYDLVMKAYQDAIFSAYRFFSYGDAMLINRQ